jgi:uncharacterized protein
MNAKQFAKQKAWAIKRRAALDAKRTPPAMGEVMRLALESYRLDPSGIHGPSHWLRVLRNGRELARLTPGADLAVIEHFSLLHDCCREDDGADLCHGERAAEYVAELGERLSLPEDQRTLLIAACDGHEHGDVSDDPTIGCCWDADRLDLSRLHRRPIADLLSTSAARRADVQAAAWIRGINQSKELL